MLAQPLELLMFETDCPYLAPTPHRGKKCEPSMLPITIETASQIFQKPVDYIKEISTQNAKNFFGI